MERSNDSCGGRADTPPATGEASQPRPVVLAVDDNPLVLKIVAKVLGRGYHVIPVESAMDALPHLATADVLLTDIAMPGMDGFALADHARANHPHLPVVFISGFLDGEILANARQRSPHLIHKPFDLRELTQRMGEIVAMELAG